MRSGVLAASWQTPNTATIEITAIHCRICLKKWGVECIKCSEGARKPRACYGCYFPCERLSYLSWLILSRNALGKKHSSACCGVPMDHDCYVFFGAVLDKDSCFHL